MKRSLVMLVSSEKCGTIECITGKLLEKGHSTFRVLTVSCGQVQGSLEMISCPLICQFVEILV
jgi:hypothetical protein